ncbi:AB hydrolase-1 domain-containing protein [Madurella fahalii]|uniref:AB hydrolase-1 domain-containing protein n=1 Tax=Madurella fahalii TaxID=1157608 RepID=A0ABQ0GJQ2_9PEZI
MEFEHNQLVKSRRSGFNARRRDERSCRPSTGGAVVLSAFIVFSFVMLRRAFDHFYHLPSNPHHNAPLTRTYEGEHISWTPCGTLADHELECSNITVPMDHFNTTNNASDNKSFTIPLLRMRSKNTTSTAIANILLNPGGPGASGTALVHSRGAQLSTILGDSFHVVGFDPRGINQSVPLADCYPSDEARQELSRVRAKKVVEDSGELWAWTGNFVRACADTMGPYAAHINTPQTAADMNAILDALGQQDMYYWGFSYGTLLGQTYATMFPERAKRVIIDGVANQFDWYEALLDREMMTDTDKVFAGFVSECIKAGTEDCALAEGGETEEELHERLVDGVGKLKDEPVGVYINSSVHGVLDFWTVWHRGIFPVLYRPAKWRELARNLALLLRGNATEAFLAYGRGPAWETVGEALKFVSYNDGTSGPTNWPTDRAGLVNQLLSLSNQSVFSGFTYDYYFSKQAWTIPRTHNYVPKHKVKTAHPLLLLSTTYDPVCPLVSAKSANNIFEGSRIIEVKGYGHCSLAVPSMCVARHVREYLMEGKLPAENVQCEVDGNPYFSKPEESIAALEALSSADEERRIRLAQLELAENSWLGPWRW